MKAILQLSRLRIENANAITGCTWGFPGISHFLGFVHALSRKLNAQCGVQLGGCAVICHDHQVQAHQPGGWEWVFALTRNPLTKDGNTAPFNEEGRMHLTVSLLIECEFDADNLALGGENRHENTQRFEQLIASLIPLQRLAGGTLTSHGQIRFTELGADDAQKKATVRRMLWRLLPGFALIERRDLLSEHHQQCLKQQADATLLDSLLDFVVLKQAAQADPDGKVEWQRIPKPEAGYLVPISVGYQAISPLYAPGEVSNSRDPAVPFRFVESAYTLGEWRSPHRFDDLTPLLWRYLHVDDLYVCRNAHEAIPMETDISSLF
ncbi:CRISPR-associated protein, Csy2 family [Andreprevotia lacus DSM 23236]|jgi:CRISPR-associated protein Csy2|uniref:CRISPR-associated protein, Csy2 family n=1 Tax=Andreprevotia lacus DSM 23236 TaxID=1121001 RepID=A0A1W1X1G3_9NEIS|nr:type I-F CRISPR-associated protein Csy2 [Andreprevotia lacus]SMC17806.1 CRISPR-associated protein, Csy2 family [Andreprevotia lacus DSM 23236]